MSQNHDKEEILEEDIAEQTQEEVDLYEQQEDIIEQDESEIERLKDMLARSSADFENFKKRTERDKADTIFFLKSDIFAKILPRLDDLDRMIKNTPEEMRSWALYEWIMTLQKQLIKDLSKLWVQSFESVWSPVDPDKHEVMTQVPWEEGIIMDEFETWYTLWDRVLRVAKVVVGNWQ